MTAVRPYRVGIHDAALTFPHGHSQRILYIFPDARLSCPVVAQAREY